MKNNSFSGAGTVFRYTVQQHYKTRSVLIFLLILFVGAVVSLPAAVLMHGDTQEITETKITQLYLRNETPYPLELSDIRADERFAKLEMTGTEADEEAMAKRLAEEKTAVCATVAMDEEHGSFQITGCYGSEGDITDADAAALNNVLENALHSALLRSLSITEAQEATVSSRTVSQVSKISDYLRGSEETDTETHVFINMFYCYFVMMLSVLSMSYIFQQCMEEKVSKLVEALLVSVSPTALMLGKLLAVTVFIFGGFGLIALGLVISWHLAQRFGSTELISSILEKMFSFKFSSLHFSAGTIILFAFCVLLAYAICAGLSGTAGSCCSKTEDIQQASLSVTMFLIIGYLAGAMAPMFERDGVNIFCSLFPPTSIFTAFPNYVCGKIGLPVFVLGLILQAVTAVLTVRLAGSVYKMMLLFRGSVPKPAQLFKMLKEQRTGTKAAAGKEDSHA